MNRVLAIGFLAVFIILFSWYNIHNNRPAWDISWLFNRYDTSVDVGINDDGAYTIAESDLTMDMLDRNRVSSDLTDEELKGVVRMREEEKLARDVYLTLALNWDEKVFENIAKSEQTHMNAVYSLIVRYGATDPVTNDLVGVFTSSDMQKLYDDFVNQGRQSKEESFKVGAAVEELDIFDLKGLLEKTDKDDVRFVYGNLSRGSRNHLRAFSRLIHNNKWTYEPRYLSESEYYSIATSSQENGQD